MRKFEYRVRSVVAAAAVAIFAACAEVPVGTPLQSNATAAAPAVAAGDSWTYRVRDGFTGLARPTERFRVTGLGDGRIQVAVSREGATGDETRVFDSQWNWLTHPATHLQTFNYSPAYPAFGFPLLPGKTWRERLTATDPAYGRRFPVTVEGVVVGWEKIRVPAGEFDAIKVKRVVYFDYQDPGVRGRSEILEYEWFAPAVKQSVRREASAWYLSFLSDGGSTGLVRVGSRRGDGPRMVRDDWLIWELETYSMR